MHWLWSLLGWNGPRPQADRETFLRREAELRERHERLERMAIEADVITRTDQPEDRPWAER